MSAGTPREAGFTLLELLVAVTLLAFLTVALAAGLRFGAQLWKKTQTAGVDADAIRSAQRVLREDLALAYPRFIVAEPGQGRIDFEGSADRLSFLSAAPSVTGQMMRIDLRVVAEGNFLSLVYLATPELTDLPRPPTRIALLDGLKDAEFAYYGTSGDDKAPGWHSRWNRERGLPDLIRIRAAFAQAGSAAWPDLVVAPRIAADVDCRYDALTRSCQGR